MFVATLLLLSFAAIDVPTVYAAEIAEIEDYSGAVAVYSKQKGMDVPVKRIGQTLRSGDRVIVAENAWVRLTYPDGSSVLLKEKTELHMEEERLVSLAKGRAFFRMLFQKMGRFSVKRGNAVIGIKGTTFMIDASGSKTEVFLKEGRIEILAVEGEFKRYRSALMEEFRKYSEKEARDFEEYKRKMEEEFIEYVKAFELEAGGAISIDGAVVRDVEIPEAIMEEFRLFEEGLNGDVGLKQSSAPQQTEGYERGTDLPISSRQAEGNVLSRDSGFPLKDGYPAWFYQPNYKGYFGAIGAAVKRSDGNYYKQKQLAKRSAEEALARQVGVMVESKLSLEKELVKKELSEEYVSTMKSLSKHDSKEFLRNAVVKDEWIDTKTGELYLWMVIEKSQGRERVDELFKRQVSGLVKGVKSEGSCAVVNMSAEQARLVALQRARANAIERAAGVEVASTTLVTNFELAVDLIKTYSKGYIVREKVEWLPLAQYQTDTSTAPIPEYRVKISADIYIPEKKILPIGLTARLNNTIFRAGEKATIDINVERDATVAIFNFTADDKVVMLFPNGYEPENALSGGKPFRFPASSSPIVLEVQNLPGHKRDAEALFIVAMDGTHKRDFAKMFKALTPMGFGEFFKRYSEIADYCDDVILPYEIAGD